MLHGAAEPFLAPPELLLGEAAHDGVGAAEVVRLVEELGKAGQCLGDLLKRVAAESCGGERLACVLDGRIGSDRPGGLEKELPGKGARRVGPARKSLADQHGAPGRRTRRVDLDAVSRDTVEIVLRTGPDVFWWKAIRLPDWTMIETEMANAEVRARHSAADLVAGQLIFHKAQGALFPGRRIVFRLADLGWIRAGSRLTFLWEDD